MSRVSGGKKGGGSIESHRLALRLREARPRPSRRAHIGVNSAPPSSPVGMSGLDFHESGARIKKWLTMMDSMTNAELDDTKGLSQVWGSARGKRARKAPFARGPPKGGVGEEGLVTGGGCWCWFR